MRHTCRHWAHQARTGSSGDIADRLEAIARLAHPDDHDLRVDPYQVAERWLQLVRLLRDQTRRLRRNRYSHLSDIDPALRDTVFDVGDVEQILGDLQPLEPFDQRISACIIGVPATS